MKRHHYFFSFTSFLIFLVFLCTGCVFGPKAEKGSGDKDSCETNPTEKTKICSIVPQKPKSATLLFDISGSMRGYLETGSDSRFIGAVSSFENLPNNISIRLYGKGESDPIEKDTFDEKLSSRKIAWGDESDLKAMVQSMIQHVKSDDVCFLVTDGILSGSDAQITNSPDRSYNITNREKMSVELKKMLEEKAGALSALVVRYISKFNGNYSCYNNFKIYLSNKERPFYIIALGKYAKIKYIEKEIAKNKTDEGLGTQSPYDNMVLFGDICCGKNVKLSFSKGLNRQKDSALVIKKEFVKAQERVRFSAPLSDLPEYMQTESYLNKNIELLVQDGLKPAKLLDKKYFGVEVVNKNGEKRLSLEVDPIQLQKRTLTFKLKYEIPDWIVRLSDDNDTDINTNAEKLNKTFNLRFLMAGFVALQKGDYLTEQTLQIR